MLLVHDETAVEENVSLVQLGYYNIVGNEVVSENGVYLGKVRLHMDEACSFWATNITVFVGSANPESHEFSLNHVVIDLWSEEAH